MKVWVLVSTESYDGPVFEEKVFNSEEKGLEYIDTLQSPDYYELWDTEVE